MRDDLSLSYTQIGLLLSVPSLVSLVVEPALGLASVTWRRRVLVLGGGVCFALALGLAAGAPSFWILLVAFSLLYPASGAFVSLSQAALMDLEPGRREHNMARWTFAGGVGVVLGPVALGGFVWVGLGWRELFAGFAVLALALVLLVRRSPEPEVERRASPPARGATGTQSARGLPLARAARALGSPARRVPRLPRSLSRRRGRRLARRRAGWRLRCGAEPASPELP